jgi:DNA repair exonuclease SbcCD ATPase subunit
MANAHHIQTVLEKSNVLDSNKEIPIRSANQLNKLSDAEIPAAYQLANDKAQDDGKKLSAKHVEQAVKELQAQLDEKQKRINWLEISHDAVEKQNDELRNRDEKIIEERIAGERAKLILENQDAIAQAKRDADNAKAEVERLKKEQAKAIKDGVARELSTMQNEIEKKQYQIEMHNRDIEKLREVESSLFQEVGYLQIHKKAIKRIKDNLSFLSSDFADVFDTATIPPETTNDWRAIKSALMTLTLELDRFTEKNAAIDGAVIESVEV